MSAVEEILEFWFQGWNDHAERIEDDPLTALWWGQSRATDDRVRDRFEAAHLQAARREIATDSASSAVANILLLDQVPRNIYRHTPHMFATDGLARNATLALMGSPVWVSVPFIHRYFALMPLMHSESLADHDRAVTAFGELVEATADLTRASQYASSLEYELRHRAIIERFGRYPHRNQTLGRTSTPEELAFLEQPGSSF